MESNIFEQASREKLRFGMPKGEINTEDLWDLSLTSLNEVAVKISRQLKDEATESFIEQPTKKNKKLQLQLDVLKHVITVRLQEKEDAKNRTEKQAKIQTLNELLEKKKLENLSALSTEEIEAQLAELKK